MGEKESSICDDKFNDKSKSDPNNIIKTSGQSHDKQLLKRSTSFYFNFEAWYKIIHNETFYTDFIPISPGIAEAFC